MSYIVYANWVGMRRWGMTGHPDIAAIRERAFARDAIDYLPDGPDEVARVRKGVAPLRWDVGMGAIVLFIVTAAFMVSGAAVLYPLQSRFEGWGLLTEQRHVWSNIHGSLIWIYYIAIIAALWGTLQALPEVYARVMQEFGQAIRPNRTWSYDRIKWVVCGYLLVSTFTIVWLDVPFDILTQVAGFILANLATSPDDGRRAVPQLQAAGRLSHPAADAGRRGGVGAGAVRIRRHQRLGPGRQVDRERLSAAPPVLPARARVAAGRGWSPRRCSAASESLPSRRRFCHCSWSPRPACHWRSPAGGCTARASASPRGQRWPCWRS